MVDGDTDTGTLQRLTKQLKDELLAQSKISKLKSMGERSPVIQVAVQPAILEKHNLTIAEVTEKIQAASLSYQTGVIKTQDARILLRADTQSAPIAQILKVITSAQGGVIYAELIPSHSALT